MGPAADEIRQSDASSTDKPQDSPSRMDSLLDKLRSEVVQLRQQGTSLTKQMWLLYVTFEDFMHIQHPERSEQLLKTSVNVDDWLTEPGKSHGNRSTLKTTPETSIDIQLTQGNSTSRDSQQVRELIAKYPLLEGHQSRIMPGEKRANHIPQLSSDFLRTASSCLPERVRYGGCVPQDIKQHICAKISSGDSSKSHNQGIKTAGHTMDLSYVKQSSSGQHEQTTAPSRREKSLSMATSGGKHSQRKVNNQKVMKETTNKGKINTKYTDKLVNKVARMTKVNAHNNDLDHLMYLRASIRAKPVSSTPSVSSCSDKGSPKMPASPITISSGYESDRDLMTTREDEIDSLLYSSATVERPEYYDLESDDNYTILADDKYREDFGLDAANEKTAADSKGLKLDSRLATSVTNLPRSCSLSSFDSTIRPSRSSSVTSLATTPTPTSTDNHGHKLSQVTRSMQQIILDLQAVTNGSDTLKKPPTDTRPDSESSVCNVPISKPIRRSTSAQNISNLNLTTCKQDGALCSQKEPKSPVVPAKSVNSPDVALSEQPNKRRYPFMGCNIVTGQKKEVQFPSTNSVECRTNPLLSRENLVKNTSVSPREIKTIYGIPVSDNESCAGDRDSFSTTGSASYNKDYMSDSGRASWSTNDSDIAESPDSSYRIWNLDESDRQSYTDEPIYETIPDDYYGSVALNNDLNLQNTQYASTNCRNVTISDTPPALPARTYKRVDANVPSSPLKCQAARANFLQTIEPINSTPCDKNKRVIGRREMQSMQKMAVGNTPLKSGNKMTQQWENSPSRTVQSEPRAERYQVHVINDSKRRAARDNFNSTSRDTMTRSSSLPNQTKARQNIYSLINSQDTRRKLSDSLMKEGQHKYGLNTSMNIKDENSPNRSCSMSSNGESYSKFWSHPWKTQIWQLEGTYC